RRSDTTKVVTVKQVGVPIFAKGKHELGRRSSRHINACGVTAAKIGVAIIEREPVYRRPVIGRLAGKGRAGLQPNYCFAAHPVAAGVKRVAGDDEHVSAITRNAAMSPNAAADGGRSPSADMEGLLIGIPTTHP